MTDDKKSGVDLAAARQKLAGLPARRLDADWLAVDRAGHVAFFSGNERGLVPEGADTTRAGEVLEAVARAASVRHATAEAALAYRGFADRPQDPVFDAPCSSRGRPAHEAPLDGYPLLVVAANAEEVRAICVEWSGREVNAREGFAAIFPVIGRTTYADLHANGACLGCRVLDDPVDPRPRAPEALAAAGIYAYTHVGDLASEPYRRIAGPTVPADLVDLEEIVQVVASLVRLPVLFEEAASLSPSDFVRCAE